MAMQQSPIEDIIDELEEYVDSCKPKVLSSSQIIVNRDEMMALIDELRAKTPEEIRRYQKIINNRDAILADANKKAEAIIAKAEIQTEELVSEHQIMQQAYAQANEVVNIASKKSQEMIDRATNDANEIRAGAIAYTDDLLTHIQEILVKTMDTTKRNADSFLAQMQGYLDVVVANRMELSPEPVETAASAPQPQTGRTASAKQQTAQPKNTTAVGQAQSVSAQSDHKPQTKETSPVAKQPQGTSADAMQSENQQPKRHTGATLAPSATPGNDKPAQTKEKEATDGETSAVRGMSDKFFNKE